MSDERAPDSDRDRDVSDREQAIAETLTTPSGIALYGRARTATARGRTLFRWAGRIGAVCCLYIIFVKFPAVLVFTSGLSFLTSVSDPVVALGVTGFGGVWTVLGVAHLRAAWAFYKLRQMTESVPATRPRRQLLRGSVVTATGLLIGGVGVIYAQFVFL